MIATDAVADLEPELASPVLELVEVVKEYPGSPPVRAVDGIDLEIAAGELVAIVGASGSGKSTLLNLIGTLDRPTSGVVRLDGFDIGGLSDAGLAGLRSQRIGFVFQQFHLLERLTVIENVATGLLYRGEPRRVRRQLAAEALERVGLGHRVTHRPPQLSGGERQRVAIARAIVGRPSIVLADEPTGNLDSHTSEEIIDVFRGLHADGATIVLITHDVELAERVPRKIVVRDGRIVDQAATGR